MEKLELERKCNHPHVFYEYSDDQEIEDCDDCDADGMTTTELGEQILSFIRRRLKVRLK